MASPTSSSIDGHVLARCGAALSLAVAAFGVWAMSATSTAAGATAKTARGAVTIAAVGDVNLGRNGSYPPGGPQSVFSGVAETIRAPISLANLETALAADGAPLTGKCNATSTDCYAFDAPGSFATGLRKAGFTVLNIANNHTSDYGSEGRSRTVDALTRAGLLSTGGPGQITVMHVAGMRIALLGFAPYASSADLLDLGAAKQLVRAAARRADVVVVSMHAGAEGSGELHVPFGSEFYLGEDRGNSRAFSHAVVDAGADLVVGHGPHVLRGLEWYRGRLIAYSLGNFSGYHTFSLAGDLAYSVALRVKLDSRGRFEEGRLVPIRIAASGSPGEDPSQTSLALLRRLSIDDFGRTAAIIDDAGRLERPRVRTSTKTHKLQRRLADLGYLNPAHVDGKMGEETSFAVTAFQKWSGLLRTGVAGPATIKALARAVRPPPIGTGTGKRVEVLLDRQLALLIDGGRVVFTIAVSTGKGSTATPTGSFHVFRKEVESWSQPFHVWLPWASYFVGGIAFHQYEDVPAEAASHGCVRVPRYDAELLYQFASLGTPVHVLATSRRLGTLAAGPGSRLGEASMRSRRS
jgi:hypothetical protein